MNCLPVVSDQFCWRGCAPRAQEFREANRGVHERVLFESTQRGGQMEGYTGNYIRITRPYDPALVNQLVDIVID